MLPYRTTKITPRLICYVGLSLILFLTACNANPGKTKEEKIDYLVETAFEDHEFIGNACVVDKGQIIYKKSFGSANAESGTPNSDSTKFLIGSLSKPFTAVLILKLAEQGKVNLTDRLGKFFNTATNPTIAKVTIHNLLTHTSGIKELINEEHEFDEDDLVDCGFNFDPGSDFEYSNSGYVILKEIAEISSGKPYSNLLKELIFSPLGMTSSGVAINVSIIPNLAIGYKNTTQEQPDKITYSLKIIDGAGSLFTTAADIVKFNQGLDSQKFLSKPLRQLMFHQHVKEKFGYGWFLRERGGVWDVSYHKGNLPGYTSFFSRRTNTNQMILLLANASSLDLDDLENDIARVLKTKE